MSQLLSVPALLAWPLMTMYLRGAFSPFFGSTYAVVALRADVPQRIPARRGEGRGGRS